MSKDDENDLPGTPWDIRVDQLMRGHCQSKSA
jgi:hypothetical protein